MKKLIVNAIDANNKAIIYECDSNKLVKQFLDLEDIYDKLEFLDEKIMIVQYYVTSEDFSKYEDKEDDLIGITNSLLVFLSTDKTDEPELIFYV